MIVGSKFSSNCSCHKNAATENALAINALINWSRLFHYSRADIRSCDAPPRGGRTVARVECRRNPGWLETRGLKRRQRQTRPVYDSRMRAGGPRGKGWAPRIHPRSAVYLPPFDPLYFGTIPGAFYPDIISRIQSHRGVFQLSEAPLGQIPGG